LDVDGRGKPEVEDLSDDVGHLKEKFDAGKTLGQLGAKAVDELLGGPVPFAQRQQDLTVQRADGAGIAVRQVDAAVGDTQETEKRRGEYLAMREHRGQRKGIGAAHALEAPVEVAIQALQEAVAA